MHRQLNAEVSLDDVFVCIMGVTASVEIPEAAARDAPGRGKGNGTLTCLPCPVRGWRSLARCRCGPSGRLLLDPDRSPVQCRRASRRARGIVRSGSRCDLAHLVLDTRPCTQAPSALNGIAVLSFPERPRNRSQLVGIHDDTELMNPAMAVRSSSCVRCRVTV